MIKDFGSDNHSGVLPEIMQAIQSANHDHAIAYGDDFYTAKAQAAFERHFGEDIKTYFVFTGTAANVLSLKAMVQPFESIISSRTSHLFHHECGAPENIIGCQNLTVPTINGKMTLEGIRYHLQSLNDIHTSRPRAISITQVTEYGTCYSLDEIKAITSLAHEHDIYVHMDGARIANAAVFLNQSLQAITKDVGVDALSFGGTKNGLMGAEAIVFFNTQLAQNFERIRKQGMQLASKMRFLACQFERLLTDNLWLKTAEYCNQMAQYLAKGLEPMPEAIITYPVESNGVFVHFPAHIIAPLQEDFFFHLIAKDEARLMCSFDTTTELIDQFLKRVRELLYE